jgi:carboxylate-amine ligase
VALGSTGTHPWADYRDQLNIDTEHYRRVVEGLGYVARRNNTFSLHVHVGVRDADRAVQVCDRLRPVLAMLLAVSASSPFLEGKDTLLHSARSQTFTKSFPRCGVPDAFGGWGAFREYLELLIATGSIVEYTQVWWSIRPHASLGTVEVRITDAQISAAESEGLAGLIVACVGQALRDIDDGVAFEHPPHRLIEENVWRAIRYGMDGNMIDLQRGIEIPARAAIESLWAWSEPVREEARIELALEGPTGAQRQRTALLETGDLREVYADAVRETMTTYAQEVPA